MVEVLNLFKQEEKEEEVIEFDEMLAVNGKWTGTSGYDSSNWDKCVLLRRLSEISVEWDYYYCQDKNGTEAIYRKKKEEKE